MNLRGASASRERHTSRNAFVVVQIALAFVLLVSSGPTMRSFQALQNVDTGFTDAKQIQNLSFAKSASAMNN